MDNRALESGAAATPPAAPASPSMGYPTKGNPSTATAASKGGVYWHYQIGEELRAILVAAGITPDHENLTQLLTALRSAGVFQTPALGDRTTKAATMACFSQEFGASLAASGYQKLPSGLIIQWGSVTPVNGASFNFPTSFPNTCLWHSWGGCKRGLYDAGGSFIGSMQATSITNSNFVTALIGSALPDMYFAVGN